MVWSGLGNDVNPAAALVEQNIPIDQSEEGPIASGADILAGGKFGTALPDEDASRRDILATKPFDTEPFARAVAPVSNASLTFLVRHKKLSVDFFDFDHR